MCDGKPDKYFGDKQHCVKTVVHVRMTLMPSPRYRGTFFYRGRIYGHPQMNGCKLVSVADPFFKHFSKKIVDFVRKMHFRF